jgi:hypothetical protein
MWQLNIDQFLLHKLLLLRHEFHLVLLIRIHYEARSLTVLFLLKRLIRAVEDYSRTMLVSRCLIGVNTYAIPTTVGHLEHIYLIVFFTLP